MAAEKRIRQTSMGPDGRVTTVWLQGGPKESAKELAKPANKAAPRPSTK